MSKETEVAVGKLMLVFAERMKQPGFRRAIHTKKGFLHDEVMKVMAAAGVTVGDAPPVPPPGPDVFIEKGFEKPISSDGPKAI